MKLLAAAVLILFVTLLSACGASEAPATGATSIPEASPSAQAGPNPQERRVAGIVDYYDSGTQGVITAPERVRAGEEFQVTITTFGGGCERAGEAEVSMAGNTADVEVYDYTVAGPAVTCTAELKRMPRTVTLSFPTPGEGLIRVTGIRVGQGTPPEGEPTVLETRLTVE